MSVTSGFFNSLNGDRRYTAEQFSELINTLVNDGVFQNVGTAFAVTASSGNEITVGIGRCWFNGVWLMNDALYPMALLDSELLLNRIDAIVIEINHSESVRAGSIRIVKGTPASDPQRPNLVKTDDVHQYPLVYIYRKAGVNEVVQADITNMVGTSECPYITGILETQDIDKIVAQWESEFNIWFEGVQDILDSDTAAKLASQIIAMDSRFETLAKERAVYEELTDSNGEMVVDINNSPVQARTVLAAEGSTASPNAIIPVMRENGLKVGDILTTIRSDPGAEWALCNGALLSRSEYPELSQYYPERLFTGKQTNTTVIAGTNTYTKIVKVIKAEDVYFALAVKGSSTNQAYLAIYYTKDPKGSWTDTGKSVRLNTSFDPDIAYGNGAVVVAYTTNSMELCIMYTKNISNPTGSTFQSQVLRAGNANVEGLCRIRFLNGQFIACGVARSSTYSDYYGRIFYATDPAGSWTARTIFRYTDRTSKVWDVEYVNGNYCIAGVELSTKMAIGPSFSSLEEIYPSSGYFPEDGNNRLLFLNNKYVAFPTTAQTSFVVNYADDPKGSWTQINWSPSQLGFTSHISINTIQYLNGYWMIAGYHSSGGNTGTPFLMWSKELSTTASNWAKGVFPPYDSTGNDETCELMFDETGDQYIFSGRSNTNAKIVLVDTSTFRIPTIASNDGTYSYIKTKE